MKKLLLIIIGAGVLVSVVWVGNFYWKNLRGVGPAISPPSEDIVELIEEANKALDQSCVITGCHDHICAEEEVFTICKSFSPEYQCYITATCERQADDKCGWTMDEGLKSCLKEKGSVYDPTIPPPSPPKEKWRPKIIEYIPSNTTSFPLRFSDPNINSYRLLVSIFAEDLDKVRDLELAPDGTLLASITDKGKVVALPDLDMNGEADEVVTILEGLNRPHGLANRCTPKDCKLYVAESDQVAVYDYDPENMKATNKKKLVDLPDGGRHYTRTLLFRPPPHDDELFVSIGSSCDTCNEEDERRAAIWTLNVKTKEFKLFAKGLRNSVFMANHPKTGKLWATDMGRDLLGDDLPPDEINIVEEDGNYGWPICYGKNIHDTVFDKNTYIRNPCQEPFETQSHIDIPAHSSPLGLEFFPGEGWPEEYRSGLLVAYHGSWNRTEPTGYKVDYYKLSEDGRVISRRPFLSGWLTQDGKSLGRPVDILAKPDGTLYISDDKAGVVYLVSYEIQDMGIPHEFMYDYFLKAADRADSIQIDNLKPNDEISSSETLIIQGRSTLKMFSPVWAWLQGKLFDQNGDLIARGFGTFIDPRNPNFDENDFNDFLFEVPYLESKPPSTKEGTLVLSFDVFPNDERTYDYYIPVQFDMTKPPADSGTTCIKSGCTLSYCTTRKVSECNELLEGAFDCCSEYEFCERQENGECGWTELEGYKECIRKCDF